MFLQSVDFENIQDNKLSNQARSFVRMTISSEVAVHQISFEHRVVNIGLVAGRFY